MLNKNLTVQMEGGLKSKGAAMFVQVAGQFESQILVELDNKKINAKSIMGVISLCINKGDSIRVVVNGRDEKEAAAALERLVKTGTWQA